jgi:predicted hotdog family 3-hydroxylacyl-ACP dehydratase
MCLLEEVLEWDAVSVRCRAVSHCSADNPLRAHGRLGSACGIEYAAQAMAVHGALRTPPAERAARAGMLVSARDVRIAVGRLDDVGPDLLVSARYVHGDAAMVLYDFVVSTPAQVVLAGRAAIAFHATPAAGPNSS